MTRPASSLIFDRTELDVENKTSKGFYNYTDLNRVEEWCKYLSEKLSSLSYNVEITTKVDWTRLNMFVSSALERIRTNVQAIKSAFYPYSTTPTIPLNLNLLNIEKANNIEKILFDIDELLTKTEYGFRYSNTFFSGEEGLP